MVTPGLVRLLWHAGRLLFGWCGRRREREYEERARWYREMREAVEERVEEMVGAMTWRRKDLVATGRALILAGWRYDGEKWLRPDGKSPIVGAPEMLLLAVGRRVVRDGWEFDGEKWVESGISGVAGVER